MVAQWVHVAQWVYGGSVSIWWLSGYVVVQWVYGCSVGIWLLSGNMVTQWVYGGSVSIWWLSESMVAQLGDVVAQWGTRKYSILLYIRKKIFGREASLPNINVN
jgi:hypothetical protein